MDLTANHTAETKRTAAIQCAVFLSSALCVAAGLAQGVGLNSHTNSELQFRAERTAEIMRDKETFRSILQVPTMTMVIINKGKKRVSKESSPDFNPGP